MTDNNHDKPKIIIDDDWKKQAQEEKQRLAEEAKQAPSQAPAGGQGTPSPAAAPTPGSAAEADAAATAAEQAGAGGQRDLPPADFSTLISSMATQVMMALGGYEDPETHQRYIDLGLAKYHIDTLAMLEKKTKGNLTDEESSLLNRALYEVRMQFVAVSRMAADQAANRSEAGGGA